MGRLPDATFAPDCTIHLDGTPIPARTGEPLTVALLAAGRPLLARSHKYHRPRGPFCLSGTCHGCLVRVDGQPDVRACRVPCRDGLTIQTQHAIPNAAHDLLGAIDLATPHGLDHHHMGTAFGPLDRALVAISRRLAGLGRLPDGQPPRPPPVVAETCDALVVGAGPAGLSAAERLATGGRRVVLADGEPKAGGRLRCRYDLPDDLEQGWAASQVIRLADSGCELALATSVLGLWLDGGAVAALLWQPGAPRLRLLRPRAVVHCAGGMAVPPLLADGDRPGVLWGRGLAVAIAEHGLVPGERAAVLGLGAEAEALSARLSGIGLEVERLAAARRALGRGRVRGLERLDGTRLDCDTVAVVSPPAPATDLARHLGAPVRFDEGSAAFALDVDADGFTGVPGLWAAGEVTGAMGAQRAADSGRRAGEAARG